VRRLAVVFVLLFASIAYADGPKDPYADDPPKDQPAGPADPYADVPGGPANPYGDDAPPTEAAKPRGLDLASVQGLLAVQSLDGWLLYDRDGVNSIARSLVAPTGTPTRAWFYWIPDEGEPTVLCQAAEADSFAHLAGGKLTYSGYKDMSSQLKTLLKGKRKKMKGMAVAMEYSPKGSVPMHSQIDAGTLELVQGFGVTVKTSASLVQFTKALWGPQGRIEHYVAVHHLVELRKDALTWLAAQIKAGKAVSELDLQARIEDGMKMRGVEGPPPVVAAGAHTADPNYTPATGRAVTIQQDDLVMISIAAKTSKPDGIYAAATWVAYVGDAVPERMASAFEVVSLARDEAINFIIDKVKRHRVVKGNEVDKAARDFVTKSNLGANFVHRTGHSLDTDLQGAAADLDDYEVSDTRALVVGSGFTIGPGVYFKDAGAGSYGVRAEVSAYLGPDGLEVTTPKQEQIEALLAK
jgi:Xaa-Pro dipeptidase